MKKIVLALFVIVLASCGEKTVSSTDVINNDLSALENYEPVKGSAEILFNEYELDFGEITKGDKLEHSFWFVNTGDVPLILTDATGSCGCTIPSKPEEAIAPGERGKIDVVVNTGGKTVGAKFSVTVTVLSNAKSNKVTLKIYGTPIE